MVEYREMEAGNENAISMFRRFGAKTRELRESRAMESEQAYRRTIRRFAKELLASKRELERLQAKRLVLGGQLPRMDRLEDIVTREELEEASIRLTLAKKIMEELGVAHQNIDMLLG